VTLTATVADTSGLGGVPTGTVNFEVGSVTMGSATLNPSGVASLVVPALPVGTDDVVAAYQGDAAFIASTSGPVVVVVQHAATTVTVTT
jgi:hypothetical protein